MSSPPSSSFLLQNKPILFAQPQKKKKKKPWTLCKIEGSISKFLPFGPTIYL